MNVYLAHPVGQDPVERERNLENTKKWFLWLLHHTDWTINVPWFIYVSCLDESYRARALRDDLKILSTCDAICLTGGRISGGMQMEQGLARMEGQCEYDLTSFGYEPPEPGSDAESKILTLIVEI
jgi:hypothetical protein